MKIGITGATGKLGTWVLAKLKERVAGDEIVALVRNPEKLEDKSIEARNFDYNQPIELISLFTRYRQTAFDIRKRNRKAI
ncbi:MAG: SDR family oxidoreductase [Saprospiraceae bacterium]